MEACGDAGRPSELTETWSEEMRPEQVTTWSVKANVRGLGVQQQVPAHWPKGPRGSRHMSGESRAGHPASTLPHYSRAQ